MSTEKIQDTDRNIEMFSKHGYQNISKDEGRSSNDIFICEKNGQEYFIKKYKNRDFFEEKDRKRFKTESACYHNLSKENLIELIEINEEEKYIVLEKVELENIEKNENSAKDVMNLYLNKLIKTEASFLPEFDWLQYESLFDKIRDLEGSNLINNADTIIKKFNDSKELIDDAKKVFSHHDYNLSNIKKRGDQLVVFDFELACRDNAMYDMATFYIELDDNEDLKKIFENELQNSELYNEDLFNLMIKRRAMDVMFGLKAMPDISYFKKNKQILDSLDK